MKNKIAVAILLTVVLAVTGCGSGGSDATENTTASQEGINSDLKSANESSQEVFAMDTYMTVTAYGKNAKKAVDASIEEIKRLDALLSTGDEDSEIAKLNVNKSATLSEDGGYLVQRGIELSTMTDGAFDIAIYPVMQEWGFPTKDFKVPDDATLKELLKLADVSKIDYDNKSREISFEDAGMEIDLGGIAKGYTSSRIMDIFKEYDVDSGLVNLGGNVQTYRTKTDGSKWRVAVQSPEDESQYIGVVDVSDKAVITSGGYERYFEQDGKIYHHIIDPATGYPAESGLKSVTIVSDDGTLADGLSTSLFIMGKDKACEFWKAHSDEFDFVLLTDDDSMYISEGIADDYSSDYEYEVINAK